MTMELVAQLLLLTVFAGASFAGLLVVLIWKKDLTTKISYLRIVAQVAALVGIYFIFDGFSSLLYLLLGIFIMSLFLGRFFCGWLCPFGLYMDLITLARKGLKIRYRSLSEGLNGALNKLRYIIFAAFLALVFIAPIDPWNYPLVVYLYGPFRPLMILLSPLEPLITPWESALAFNGVNFSWPYASDILYYVGGNLVPLLSLAFVAITVAASFAFRRFWCRFCPTGISLAAINRIKAFRGVPVLHLYKEEEKCTKCGICKRVCPPQVTEVYEERGGKIAPSMCLLCMRCVEMCPYEGCLKVKFGGKTLIESRNWLEPADV
ncbi:MAG: 4Fe-4S binding protein [Candidatus Bathyarchaeia archaeon]|jgi:polyferredoxin